MTKTTAFDESVAMGFQLYNGLLLNLPFEDVKEAGILLPVFASYCKQRLEAGDSPVELVENFFLERLEHSDFHEVKDDLFRFLRLVERQIVLFDSLEDSAYSQIHDIQGPGSLKDILNHVERDEDLHRLKNFISDYKVRIVLTAHPTQFYTDQVLGILVELADSLKRKDLQEINDRLLQLGKTRFKKKKKPTPMDEAESMMGILEDVMFHVLPDIHSRLVQEVYQTDQEGLSLPGIVELGFWPGGDRDGNPFVDADTTKNVALMLKKSILTRYLEEGEDLSRRLTFDGVYEAIQEIHDKLTASLEEVSFEIRSLQGLLDNACLEQNSSNAPVSYTTAEELLKDLINLRTQVEREHQGLFLDHVDRLIFKVQTFGFHFASVDVRQDSRIHQGILEGVLPQLSGKIDMNPGETPYSQWEEADKTRFLLEAVARVQDLQNHEKRGLYHSFLEILDDPVQRDSLQSLRAISYIQKQNGEKAAHRYIISNTQAASDILEVWLLSHISAFYNGEVTLDIVPLFETIEDLHMAPEVMEELYRADIYARHLIQRKHAQHIMLGFSDGTKDGGYVSANWEIFRAKENLTRVTREFGHRVLFFDGRGGPPARGGGNTHKFYRSLGEDIDSTSIQLTIQGQTITSTYGTVESATHNMEQLVSAGIENNLFPLKDTDLRHQRISLMDELSLLSREYYIKLKDHPRFLSYLEEITPLTYYGKTNIGSRPSKRNQSAKLSLDSLRAIPFVGAWSQMKQNIPGFYGFGYALENLISQGKLGELQDLYHKSLFFHTLVENSMQSLSKAYFPLTGHIAKDPEYKEFWGLLKEEADRTVEALKQISGQEGLLANDPVNRNSIKLRENMILPCMVIQQYALQKLREAKKAGKESEHKEVLEKLIIKSLAASINASRNSV